MHRDTLRLASHLHRNEKHAQVPSQQIQFPLRSCFPNNAYVYSSLHDGVVNPSIYKCFVKGTLLSNPWALTSTLCPPQLIQSSSAPVPPSLPHHLILANKMNHFPWVTVNHHLAKIFTIQVKINLTFIFYPIYKIYLNFPCAAEKRCFTTSFNSFLFAIYW